MSTAMEFGKTLNNPLLRFAVGIGEATIREACGMVNAMHAFRIHVEMDQFPDGRDAVRITVRTKDAIAGFAMVLRKYFDRQALWRVASHAWRHRVPCGTPPNRLGLVAPEHAAVMN